MSQPKKHHYLPVFYLKQWAAADGMLLEYARRYHSIRPRKTHPRGTGYEINLYTFTNQDAELRQDFETGFMSFTDGLAAKAHRKMLTGDKSPWDVRTRSGWTRFMVSLMLRAPSEIERFKTEMKQAWDAGLADIKANYAAFRREDDPPTYDEFVAKIDAGAIGRSGLVAAQRVMDNPKLGTFINQLTWEIVNLEGRKHKLLTSDRPVIVSNGLINPNGHMGMPISPTKLFVAYKHDEFKKWLRSTDPEQLIVASNANVVGQARTYVYGKDDSQRRFIQNRFGKMPERDYFAGVAQERPPMNVLRNTDFTE